MAAPNVNGRLHLTGVHQKSPASLAYLNYKTTDLSWIVFLRILKVPPYLLFVF